MDDIHRLHWGLTYYSKHVVFHRYGLLSCADFDWKCGTARYRYIHVNFTAMCIVPAGMGCQVSIKYIKPRVPHWNHFLNSQCYFLLPWSFTRPHPKKTNKTNKKLELFGPWNKIRSVVLQFLFQSDTLNLNQTSTEPPTQGKTKITNHHDCKKSTAHFLARLPNSLSGFYHALRFYFYYI